MENDVKPESLRIIPKNPFEFVAASWSSRALCWCWMEMVLQKQLATHWIICTLHTHTHTLYYIHNTHECHQIKLKWHIHYHVRTFALSSSFFSLSLSRLGVESHQNRNIHMLIIILSAFQNFPSKRTNSIKCRAKQYST